MSEKRSFWSTMPGVLTGIAAIITAIGGLVLTLSQTGLLGDNSNKGSKKKETTTKKVASKIEILPENANATEAPQFYQI